MAIQSAKTKPCCTVCDARKRCHVCDDQTLWACSDCQMNFRTTVYVCAKPSCRDEHEVKCFGDGSRQPARDAAIRAESIAELRRAREVLWDAATLVEEYSCRTPVGHIATECEEVVRRARAALGQEPANGTER